MPKSRDLQAELRQLQAQLNQCLQRTFPSRQFHAELMLAMVSLGLTARRFYRARDLGERRRLADEFANGARAMRRGMKILWQSRWGASACGGSPSTQAPSTKTRVEGALCIPTRR